MDIILTLFALTIPLILVILGILESRVLLVLVGAFILIVAGVYMLYSPPEVFYVSSVEITKNVTASTSTELLQYTYSTRPLDDSMNLAVSTLAIFFGLGAIFMLVNDMFTGRGIDD